MNDVTKAVLDGDEELLISLLDKNSDLECKDRDERTPLINAAICSKANIVSMLIQRGANVNAQDKLGYSSLHYASQNNDYNIARILLENDASVDLQDNYGNTALFRAVFNSKGKGDLITLLISHGANMSLKNKHDISPFELAKSIANYNITRFMHYE